MTSSEKVNGKIRLGIDAIVLKIIAYIAVASFAVCCIFPFLLMVSSSSMEESEITAGGFKLIPNHLSSQAYQFLFQNSNQIITAYEVTIFITIVGTVVGLLLMTIAGYVLNRKDFKYRNIIAFFIYFTTLFSGGLIPTYILMVKTLGLKDNLLAIILPHIISAWSIFLLRNFMKSVPDALFEAATIDGAGDFRVFFSIYLPLSKPAMATIGLFLALGFWNEWYNAMLYLQTPSKFPLQLFLQHMVNQTDISSLVLRGVQVDISKLPTQSVKMATGVLAAGPIILLYPFLQRYFISGLVVGSIKG